jgi:hypothetical protein
MTQSDSYDQTVAEHEQFERALLAQDGDARRPSTADLAEDTVRQLVRDLLDAGTVTPIVAQRVLVHEPSGAVFESIEQLAVFHRGWTAARATDDDR